MISQWQAPANVISHTPLGAYQLLNFVIHSDRKGESWEGVTFINIINAVI